jgi:hypothetical protein
MTCGDERRRNLLQTPGDRGMIARRAVVSDDADPELPLRELGVWHPGLRTSNELGRSAFNRSYLTPAGLARTRSTVCESHSHGFAPTRARISRSTELVERAIGPRTDSTPSRPLKTLAAPSYGSRRDVGRRLWRPQ